MSADDNALLRRELSRLAAQILAVARAQGAAQVQQRVVVEVAQAYTDFVSTEEPQEPQEAESDWHPMHAGNGAARESEMAEPRLEVDTVAADMARAAEDAEGPAAPEEAVDSDSEEPKGLLAKRFAARREKRRARKTGGVSLSDRLRGLVAERPPDLTGS